MDGDPTAGSDDGGGIGTTTPEDPVKSSGGHKHRKSGGHKSRGRKSRGRKSRGRKSRVRKSRVRKSHKRRI